MLYTFGVFICAWFDRSLRWLLKLGCSIFIIPLEIRLYIEDCDEDEKKNNKYLHKNNVNFFKEFLSWHCNMAIRKICFHFSLIVVAYSIHKESEEEVRSNIIRIPRQSRGAFFKIYNFPFQIASCLVFSSSPSILKVTSLATGTYNIQISLYCLRHKLERLNKKEPKVKRATESKRPGTRRQRLSNWSTTWKLAKSGITQWIQSEVG